MFPLLQAGQPIQLVVDALPQLFDTPIPALDLLLWPFLAARHLRGAIRPGFGPQPRINSRLWTLQNKACCDVSKLL